VVLSAASNQRVEDRHAGDHRSGQDPRAVAAVERGECVGRRADVRLRAVDEYAMMKKTTKLMPLMRHKRSQKRGCVHAGG